MSAIRIAVPSALPGGLDAAVGEHFGHCDIYTIITAQDGAVQAVETLENMPHVQGGCMAPVNHLASNGVQVLIAGGMGMRPLMGFQQVGITVFHGAGAPSVGHAVQALLEGALRPFAPEATCGGGCS
ncbi:NifB/NifX family molybdenum-iron cluster-binding protein [Megalodesulfovibrio gigas]|uniref:Putative dinitrogenase iron-molybdenum cofactor biosynthesis protein n=1 Tax=Megalodesulfovibrio gigas (strain ATCC 19364 / DSM 1382 / NCIMB 9332 / VKM B-1759) TaxID=1121448 RepID=T2GC49_MEGG1|nr:NifB/NifX family molybdenum-iron cluster-binding protein [Megalodesulfovibrio gigas]AGW13749.1 putative dinitrogenase iron-molybdenum cofactor biosynthesis protein [Megalodesulfovibrio gigas DSM 1382 = ATCC 19364]